MNSEELVVGSPEDWAMFAEENEVFMQKLPGLHETFRKTFNRTVEGTSLLDRVIFILGRICFEEFNEISLLCGNGYGIGGLKIVRCLYERAVTMQYIATHPSEVDKFWQYHLLNQGKLYNHTIGAPGVTNSLSPERVQQIETDYKNAAAVFGKQTWSKLNTLSMARKSAAVLQQGESLDGLYGLCFARPTLHIHPTSTGCLEWIEEADEGFCFNAGVQRTMVWQAMMCAHGVMLYVLTTQDTHFSLGLHDEIQNHIAEYRTVWSGRGHVTHSATPR